MDYFNSRRRPSSAAGSDHANVPATPGGRRPPMGGAPSYESLRPPSAIRIRRLPSGNVPQAGRPATHEGPRTPEPDTAVTGRRRSSSAPQRPLGHGPPHPADLARQQTLDGTHMPAISEADQVTPLGGAMHPGFEPGAPGRPTTPSINVEDTSSPQRPPTDRVLSGAPAMHSAGYAAQRNRPIRGRTNTMSSYRSTRSGRAPGDEYESDVIDLLDLVDPEVRTIGTLTNLQNSLFIPDLGGLVNRRPTYDLTRRTTSVNFEEQAEERKARSRAGTRASRLAPPPSQLTPIPQETAETPGQDIEMQESRRRTFSISSELSDSRFAVLPSGVSLEGWSDEEIEELNDHVRHLLHSRKEGFKRGWRGFRKYISRPLGLFVVVYATLVTLFGAAWVFCLIGWIYVGNRQDYFINVIDNILVALFALMGDGLAPFRAVDTYHMCFIAHYHHLTWRLRREQKLPELVDENDLPDRRVSVAELEDMVDKEETAEFSVLNHRQQKRLQYHQAKFNKSHTFYKPHETSTHHAFPLRLLVAVVVLLDCHSLFQVALGTCTWSINYKVRPEALTATILSCSITCNIMAGVVISIGDHKTRKKDVLERIFRQGLTEEAMKRMAKNHERGELNVGIKQDMVESDDIKNAAQDVKQADAGPSVAEQSKSNVDAKTAKEEFHTPTEEAKS